MCVNDSTTPPTFRVGNERLSGIVRLELPDYGPQAGTLQKM
jgi:hypothetical protein